MVIEKFPGDTDAGERKYPSAGTKYPRPETPGIPEKRMNYSPTMSNEQEPRAADVPVTFAIRTATPFKAELHA